MKVGVLALQGAFAEHAHALTELGAPPQVTAAATTRNGEFLGEYLVEPGADEVVTQFTRILLDTVPFKGTPREVAQSLRDIYDQIIAEQAAASSEEHPPA